ncbi:MAG: NAD(P)-dependent oxidoreductase [Thalassobaculaceae bacterium]|nr:NAD(P)-dependent oxidoreductase [Thalassobaculaceae bacterium]
MTSETRIGFIGLGRIGGVMAERLLKAGYGLVVCDTNPEACDRFRAMGAEVVETPVALADTVEIAFLSLPMPSVLKTVCLGADGLNGGRKMKVAVDLSTSGPAIVREVAAIFEQSGKALVDAPVSGGVTGAAAGTLALMASGSGEALDRVKPMFDVLAKDVFIMGDEVGLGQTMKLVNNMVAACCSIASFEATVFGVKAGLSADRMLEVMNVSSGRNFATMQKMPNSVLPGTFPAGFATELMLKDVSLAVDEAETSGARLWMGTAARAFFEHAVSQGYTDQDYAETIKILESRAGVEVRSKP